MAAQELLEQHSTVGPVQCLPEPSIYLEDVSLTASFHRVYWSYE